MSTESQNRTRVSRGIDEVLIWAFSGSNALNTSIFSIWTWKFYFDELNFDIKNVRQEREGDRHASCQQMHVEIAGTNHVWNVFDVISPRRGSQSCYWLKLEKFYFNTNTDLDNKRVTYAGL